MKEEPLNTDSSREEGLPEAVLVGRDVLASSQIELRDLPVAAPLSAKGAALPARERPVSAGVKAHPEALELDRVASIDFPAAPLPSSGGVKERNSESVNRKALERTNRGVSPNSRRFVRGVLHHAPRQILLAAFFSLTIRLALVVGVVTMGLFVFGAVEKDALWGLLAIPVLGLGYLATFRKARCRVCGVQEFFPSGARKHIKTHRFLFLGPIASTSLHVLIFKWFHCMFCGTAIRVKK